MTVLQSQTPSKCSVFKVPALFLFVFYSLSAFSVEADFYPDLATGLISEDLSKGANAVIRYHKTVVQLEAYNRMTIRESAAITVLNKRAAHYLNFYEGFKESSEQLSNISVEYLNAQGFVVTKVKSKNIEEVTPPDGISLISDYKAKFVGFEPNAYPITIRYSFDRKSSTTLFLPTWRPIPTERVSVESSEYKLMNLTDSEISMQEFNTEGYEISNDQPFQYKLLNAKKIVSEKYDPPFSKKAPLFYFRSSKFNFENIEGQFNDWDSYGKWVYHELLKPRKTLNELETFAEINKVISPNQPKEDIVKEVYEYVQKNTRYIFVGLQEGGLVPMHSQDVHDLKYGDCKALTFYTQALLDLYDIPSNYVINEANPVNQISFSPEYCDALQGNHIILQVPMDSDTLWMDCTSNDNPFNFLGSFTDDRLVLAVNERGGTLVRTPKYDADLYKDICKTEIMVSDNGSISIDYNLTNYGLAMDDRMRFYRMSKEDQIDDLKDDFDHLLNLKISELEIDIDKDNLTSTEHFVVESSQYGEQAGQYYIIPMRFEPLSVPNLGKKKNRKYPILFERAYKEIKEDTYIVPQGFSPNLDEVSINYNSEYGKYSRTAEKLSDNKFVIKRSFELVDAEYPAEDYSKVKSFFNKIRKAELSKMTIEKKTIRP